MERHLLGAVHGSHCHHSLRKRVRSELDGRSADGSPPPEVSSHLGPGKQPSQSLGGLTAFLPPNSLRHSPTPQHVCEVKFPIVQSEAQGGQ